MDFAERLIQYREAHNLTQEALAERLGISRRMLYKYEAGISVPRASTLKRICDELRISSDAMLGEETQQLDPQQEIDRVVHDVSALFAGGVLPEEDKDLSDDPQYQELLEQLKKFSEFLPPDSNLND